jgi:hypothetical protein
MHSFRRVGSTLNSAVIDTGPSCGAGNRPGSRLWPKSIATGAEHPIDLEMRWNFGDSRSTSLSLDEFLAQKKADGVEFFVGKEPWLVGLRKLSWQPSSGSALKRWMIFLKGL